MRQQQEIFVFDVDGVLTNPYTKIANQTLLRFIAEKLNNREYVALVTGRAVEWIAKVILPEIRNKLQSGNSLDFLFLSGEMGSVTTTFENGQQIEHVDTSVILPADIVEETKERLKGKENLVFVDPDKKTLLTLEMQGGSDKEVSEQTGLLNTMKGWFEKEIIPAHPEYEAHVSSIALDLLKKGINKKLSITKLLAFLEEKGISGETFITCGDSPSDVQMAEALHEKRYRVTFIYVGPHPLEKKYPFPIVTPQNGVYFDSGVIEVITQ